MDYAVVFDIPYSIFTVFCLDIAAFVNENAADPSDGRCVRGERSVGKFARDFNMTAVIVSFLISRRVFIEENAVRHTMDIVALFIGSYIVIIVMTDKTKFFTVLDMNLVRAFYTEEPDAVIDINNV